MTSKSVQPLGPHRETADSPEIGEGSATVSRCPSCALEVPSSARFCQGCGVSLDPRSASKRRSPKTIAMFAAAALGIVAALAAAVAVLDRDKIAAPGPALFPAPGVGSAPTVDLSTLTPREAADRLFNRIMMASERGDRGEAMRFVPMALAAYARLETLDADAYFHLGRIHAVAGDLDHTRQQISRLKGLVPSHLLGLILEHALAKRSGDEDAASRVTAAFAAAYDTEIEAGRREYADHRKAIEKFRAAAGGSRPAFAALESTDAMPEAAALFAQRCALCPGRAGGGTKSGPPLVHPLYEPNHHADGAFTQAVRQGVRAHHWAYGDMPPIEGVSDRELGRIISHVRALQTARRP